MRGHPRRTLTRLTRADHVNPIPFPPFKRTGLVWHAGLLILLLVALGWNLYFLLRSPAGPSFVMHLLLSLVSFAPLPLLAYRAYALWGAVYTLDREKLHLHWGLRAEQIPLGDIEWVRPASALTHPLRLPPISMPGALLGLRRHPDLGLVEFLASERKHLLLVGTARRVYAISPHEASEFVQAFARATEMGSLSPTEPRSVYPSFIVTEAWSSGLVRYLWLAALFLNLGLFVWVSLLIPALPAVALGFRPDRSPAVVPSTQLIILPLVSTLLALTGWGAGLYFYRWEGQRILSFAVWACSALMSLLFLVSVWFIIATPI